MEIIVTNQTRQLLILTLNSGKTLYLPPDQSSEPVDHLEINGNTKVAKLLDSGAITISHSKITISPGKTTSSHSKAKVFEQSAPNPVEP